MNSEIDICFFFFFLFVLIFEIKFCLLVFFPTKRNISKSGYILCCFGQFVSLFFNNPIGIKHTLNYSFVNSILFVQSCFLLLVLYQFYVKHTFCIIVYHTYTRNIYLIEHARFRFENFSSNNRQER